MVQACEDITDLLLDWRNGDHPGDALASCIYPQLRQIAARQLSASGPEVRLQTTELVHEAFLRLVDQRRVSWRNRAHFFAISARLIRRIVIDHVRECRSGKRGGGAVRVSLEELQVAAPGVHPDLLDLDEALEALALEDAEAARVVEMRYFGGLTIEETAEALGVGRTTVVRTWRFARAWLRTRLVEDPA